MELLFWTFWFSQKLFGNIHSTTTAGTVCGHFFSVEFLLVNGFEPFIFSSLPIESIKLPTARENRPERQNSKTTFQYRLESNFPRQKFCLPRPNCLHLHLRSSDEASAGRKHHFLAWGLRYFLQNSFQGLMWLIRVKHDLVGAVLQDTQSVWRVSATLDCQASVAYQIGIDSCTSIIMRSSRVFP